MTIEVAEKAITIRMPDNDNPIFVISGEWSGHDIKAVRNLLWRAYLRHSREVRRNEAIIKEE